MSSFNTTTWRTHPQKQRIYAYILNPAVVFRRRVNEPSGITYPTQFINYDNPDAEPGDWTDVKQGMTLRFIDGSTGRLKGIRHIDDPNGLNLVFLHPISQAEIDVQDNDIMEVVDEYRLRPRVPYVTEEGQNMDYHYQYLSSRTQRPVANTGSWFAAIIDPDTELITVPFADLSFATEQGASIASRSRDIADGTYITGNSSSATATVTFPQGVRWVSQTVTDTNGKTHTARALIVAASEEDVLPVEVSQLAGDIDGGWECGMRLVAGDASDYPEGACVILWAEERYGDTEGSLNGQAGREHILFTGWLTDDVTLIDPLRDNWTFTAANAMAHLGQLPAFPTTITISASPSSWYEMSNLTWWRFAHQIIDWYCNLIDLCDFYAPSFANTYPVMELDSQGDSLQAQFQFEGESVWGWFTVDHQNICRFVYNPHLLSSAAKSALTTIVTLADSDWGEGWQVARQHRDPVGFVEVAAVKASSTELSAFKAIAPGQVPTEGLRVKRLTRQMVLTQADANAYAGRVLVFENERTRSIPIEIFNMGLVADPAWGEWVKFNYTGNNKRGLSYNDQKFSLSNTRLTFFHKVGAMQQNWTLVKDPETSPTGVTVQIPGEEPPEEADYIETYGTISQQPVLPSIYVSPPPLMPPDETPEEVDAAYAVAWGETLKITNDIGTDDVTWDDSDAVEDFECISVIHAGTPNPATDPVKMCALWSDGTDCLIRYNPDPFNGEAWETRQTFEGFDGGILRHVAGVAGGEAFAAILKTNGSAATYDDSLTGGLGPKTKLNVPGLVVALADGSGNITQGQQGDYSGGEIVGEYSGIQNGFAQNLNIAVPIIDLGAPSTVTLTRAEFKRDPDTSGGDIVRFDWYDEDMNHISGVNKGNNTLNTSYATYSDASTVSNVRYIALQALVAVQTPYCDNIHIEYTPNENVKVEYTDDAWQTVSEVNVGAYNDPDKLAGDWDDYNRNVQIIAASRGIYYGDSYTQTDLLELSGLTGIDGLAAVNLVRIPALKPSDPDEENDDETDMEFIFGTADGVSGATLWLVAFDATDGTIHSQTDITPIISSNTYIVIGAQALESEGINPLNITAGGQTGANKRLIQTDDGGTTWAIIENSRSGDLVRYRVNQSGELAVTDTVADLFNWSTDAGASFDSQNGDFPSVRNGFYVF